uniref:BMERB domain-containing protein n=1 Tax=Caenorhabditis tropicalis TaxID=1561998 RepID=A0A1I7U7D5_9PELO
MTITDESTSRVVDSTAPPTTTSPSIFQRICCCCNSDLKEPPVQLIRSGSLTYQQGTTVTNNPDSSPSPQNNLISAAKRSIDDDSDKPQTSQKPNSKRVEGDAESINMNDILMENVLKTTEEDRTEAVEEDIVSISTNVVQEIDENELKKALKKTGNDSNEMPMKLKGRSGISKEMTSGSEAEEEDIDIDNRKMSVIEFIRSEAQAETSAVLQAPAVPQKIVPNEEIELVYKNEKLSEATQSEMSDSEEEEISDGKQINMVGMSSKTTARADKTFDEGKQGLEFKELSSDESLKGSIEDEDEEIIMNDNEDIPPPLPLSPPPNHYGQLEGSPIPPPRSPRRSMMYANADDSDSDDEESEDAHPVASNGLVRIHPVNFAPNREDDIHSISSASTLSTASETSEKENDEETTIGVTRISVKSDGRAEIHSPKSPVRVTLETDRNEITDDDFSEKLI